MKCVFCESQEVEYEVVTALKISGSRLVESEKCWRPVCNECIKSTIWEPFLFEERKIKESQND